MKQDEHEICPWCGHRHPAPCSYVSETRTMEWGDIYAGTAVDAFQMRRRAILSEILLGFPS